MDLKKLNQTVEKRLAKEKLAFKMFGCSVYISEAGAGTIKVTIKNSGMSDHSFTVKGSEEQACTKARMVIDGWKDDDLL